MKLIVLVLAVAAAIKIGVQEALYRAATSDVIVNAYRDRAIAACAKEPGAQAAVQPNAWQEPSSLRLMIGKSSIDVYLWQIEHQLWNARYANPYIVVEAQGPSARVMCEYDIVHATASLQQL